MFGEHKTGESPRQPSPWSTPPLRTPISSSSQLATESLSSSTTGKAVSTARRDSGSSSDGRDRRRRRAARPLPRRDQSSSTTLNGESSTSSSPSSPSPTEDDDGEDDSGGGETSEALEVFGSSYADSRVEILVRSRMGVVGAAAPFVLSEEAGGGRRQLSAEVDHQGHIEYKLKLSAPNSDRFNRLTTQLKWRLLEGGGEAMYEIGVLDDGTLVGLSRADLLASLGTLERMADELGATVVVLKEIRLSKEDRPVPVDDKSLEGRRRKWEAWQAEQQAWAVKAADELVNKSEDSGGTNGSQKLNKGGVIGRNSSSRSWWKKKSNASLHAAATAATAEPVVQDPPASLVTPSSILTAQLVPSKQSQDRSIRKKRYPSLLGGPDHHSHSASNGFNGKDHHNQPCPTSSKNGRHSRLKNDNDDCGIFAVLDLELDATASIPSTLSADRKKDSGGGGSSSSKPAGLKSTKQRNSEEKATRRKLKRDEADAAALKPAWGEHGEGPFPVSDKEDYGAWGGQSLDVWGADDVSVTQTKKEGSVAANVPSSQADNVVLPSLKDFCISSSNTTSTETTVPPPQPSSPTLSPSPLLLPTYRPASLLLSQTSDAAFPPFHEERGNIRINRHNGNGDGTGQITHGSVAGDGAAAAAGAEGQGQAYEQVEDGTERICVEVLVLRKEMEGHIRFDDVARWLNGGGD